MTTPNLDATGHQCISALAKYDFWLEYQKGRDNAVADALSRVSTHINPEVVQAVLDGAAVGTSQRAERENPAVIESDQQLEKEVRFATGWVLVEMHVTDWAVAQKEDPELDAVLQWLGSKKKADLRTLLRECITGEEGQMVWMKSPELHFSLRYPLFALHPQRGEWGSVTICSTQGALNCHPKWMPLRCRTPRPWLYPFPVAKTFLVARNGQANETSYQGLQTLPPIQGQQP